MKYFKTIIEALKNIKRGPVTTIIGVVLIASAIGTVYAGQSTWEQAIVILIVGLWLAVSKDPSNYEK